MLRTRSFISRIFIAELRLSACSLRSWGKVRYHFPPLGTGLAPSYSAAGGKPRLYGKPVVKSSREGPAKVYGGHRTRRSRLLCCQRSRLTGLPHPGQEPGHSHEACSGGG